MFKRFRIAILLYILLFVAVGEFLASSRATDWNDTLWVDVYPVNAEAADGVARYINGLDHDSFSRIEEYFSAQAQEYGVSLEAPFRIRLAEELTESLPPVPDQGGFLQAVVWSLKMRWFVTRLHWSSETPTPDITLFAIYHEGEAGVALDRSTALRKGRIAVANLFGNRHAHGTNQMIMAHEILHTLGATDKYSLADNQPIFPHGFAEPERDPLYPQQQAELMAGRIPVGPTEAITPASLAETMVGEITAAEIGWRDLQ